MKTISTIILLSLRNSVRQKRRTLITAVAIAIGVLSSNFLALFSRGLAAQLVRDAVDTLTGEIQLLEPGYRVDPAVERSFALPEQIQKLMSEAGAKQWTSRVRLPVVASSERESVGINLVGIELAEEQGLSFIGKELPLGDHLSAEDPSGIVVGKALLDKLETRIGRRIVIIAVNKLGKSVEKGFVIRGVFDTEIEATELEFLFVNRSVAQEFFGLGVAVTEVSARITNSERLEFAVEKLRKSVFGPEVVTWKELKPMIHAITVVHSKIRIFWALLVGLIISFSLLNSMFMAVYERIPELGLYGALGLRPAGIVLLVAIESLILLLIGAMLGNIFTAGLYLLLSGKIDLGYFAAGAQSFGFRSEIWLTPVFVDILLVNLVIIGIGCLWSLYPAYRASQVPPVVAMK